MNYIEALYHFRKFAIQNGFIKEYGNQSNIGLFKWRGVKDLPLGLRTKEPIEYIQNSSFFCVWPTKYRVYWQEMSIRWAAYCFNKGIFFDITYAINYRNTFIDS